MKNTAIVAALAALMAFGAVVACGGGTPAPATPDPAASAAATDGAGSAAPAAPATSK
jgi:hypothetical protein